MLKASRRPVVADTVADVERIMARQVNKEL